MKRTVIFDKRARQALADIGEYITKNSGSTITAQRYTNKLRAKCQSFARYKSQLGRPRPELGEGVRSFAFEHYVIYMRYTKSSVEIITILSHARDIEGEFEDETP